MRKQFWVLTMLLVSSWPAFGQENGKLQIHFMDVGQGDGALLISPQGKTVLFDNGARNNCDKPVMYLEQLGITRIDYHITSHYHDDHIGCAVQVLSAYPLQETAFDRGETYTTKTYRDYVQQVGEKRRTARAGESTALDSGVRIEFVALNGAGIASNNENDKSVTAVIRFGQFDAVMAGDLSGANSSRYKDIESAVGPLVGQVEVYKVNHHGSSHSSNENWLTAVKPRIGIISCGDGNPHGHPTEDALNRLHDFGVKTYWTERGAGVQPQPGQDVVGGSIVVEVAPGASEFTVTSDGGRVDTYALWGSSPAGGTRFSWSKRSSMYHLSTCRFVAQIRPGNLETGNEPPKDRTLHEDCPR